MRISIKTPSQLHWSNPELHHRKLSLYEHFCLAAEKQFPPFCIQSVVEGTGDLDINTLRAAVEQAAEANPGSRFILRKNHWWDTGIPPLVRELDPAGFSGKAIEQHPIFSMPIDSKKGPTTQVYLVKGEPTRVIFRCAHSIMDGKGAQFFAEEVFRALRNEPLIGTNAQITDEQLIKSLNQKAHRQPTPFDCSSPTGARAVQPGQSKWSCRSLDCLSPESAADAPAFESRRVQIPGTGHAIAARLASILAKECAEKGNTHTRVMIPVDLRSHAKDIHSTGNLFSSLCVDVDAKQSWQQIQQDLIQKLIDHKEGAIGRQDWLLKKLPASMVNMYFKHSLQWQLNHNRFRFTGFLSDVGKVDLNRYTCPHLTPLNVYNVHMDNPMAPISITTVTNPDHIELTLSMPRDLATNGRLDRLVDKIVHGLNTSDIQPKVESQLDRYSKTLKQLPVNFDPLLNSGQGPICFDHVNQTLHHYFESQVQKTPNAIAIKSPRGTMTYAELDARANQLARTLQSHGAGPNKVVALISERSMDFMVGLLAILKSGSGYLPIDPKAPKDRQAYILKDSKAQIVLTHAGALRAEPETAKVLHLNDPTLYQTPSTPPETLSKPADLAYMIYTSGSTGLPKGVAVEHQSVLNHILWAKKEFMDPGKSYVVPLFTSIAFDLTGTSIFLPIFSGNTLKVYGEDHFNMTIARIAEDPEVNWIKATPSHLKMLNALNLENCGLKKIVVGGEEFTSALGKSVTEKLKGKVEIYNEYGPTEGTIACLCHKFDPTSDTEFVPIGKAIDNTQIYVLDDKLKPVPMGEPGEICIGGVGVARGYINRPEVNAKRFIDNPFKPGEKMYRTGDMGKWLAPDMMMYLGREDDQVKIRGHRIELGEIESQLARIPGMKNCAVVPRSINDETVLAAYMVADHDLDIAAIRDQLKIKLPDYMIPVAFAKIDHLPTTINGKLNRRELPEPIVFHAKSTTGSENNSAISDKTTRQLAQLWAKVLNITLNSVQEDSNFAQLGGNSLSMVQLISEISKHIVTPAKEGALMRELDQLIGAPNLSAMAEVVRKVSDPSNPVLH